MFASDLHDRGLLVGDTVVATVMTNLGFNLAMAARGITVRHTKVGDRYVLEAMEAEGLYLGGEQSGHIIFRQLATTGDGLLTGLLLMDLVARSGQPFEQLAVQSMTRLPQELVNVTVAEPGLLEAATVVWDEVALAEKELGGEGRVLLRASGTEPLVRVMVEASEATRAKAVADHLTRVVERELGGS